MEKLIDDDSPDQFKKLPKSRQILLIDWIQKNFYPIKTVNTKHTSYGLKHQVKFLNGEDDYFTNGEFKGAMLECGYVTNDTDRLNWCFNISERSIHALFKKNNELSNC